MITLARRQRIYKPFESTRHTSTQTTLLGNLCKTDFYIALSMFSLMLAVALQVAVAGVCGTFHDDGVYISTAKSLADGNGYRLISFPGEPWQVKYPILYPLALALVWKICPEFPSNIDAMQCLTAICASVFVALSYLYLVRFSYTSRVVALFAVALTISVPGFAFFSGQILSEMPFALSTIVALWHLEHNLEKSSVTTAEQVSLGVALSIPFLIRLIGLAVPIGAIACLLLNRRPFFKTGMITATIFLIGVGAPAIYGSSSSTGESDNVRSYQTNYVDWWKRYGLESETKVVAKNLLELPGVTGKSVLSGVVSYGQPLAQQDQLKWTCLLLGLIPWFVLGSQSFRNRGMSLIMWSYMVVVLLWPWPPFRFIVPILPLLYALIFHPVEQMAKRSPLAGALAMPFFIIALCTNIGATICLVSHTHQTNIPVMDVPARHVSWSSFNEIFDWVKKNTSSDDRLAATYDSMFYLYTGRTCVRPYELNIAAAFYESGQPIIGNADDLLLLLERYRIRYLVVTPQPNYCEEQLVYNLAFELRNTYPTGVKSAFSSADGRFQVFKIVQ